MSAAHKKTMRDGQPVEIERKYLIKLPDMELLKRQEGYDASFIEQIYLGGGNRIRRREFADGIRCYFTQKREINGISRFETEHEISLGDYAQLAQSKLGGTVPIRKVRHCFLYKEQLFELDEYDLSERFASLEIELQSEEQQVELPPFIDVIADVTGDKRFRNFALAHTSGSFDDTAAAVLESGAEN